MHYLKMSNKLRVIAIFCIIMFVYIIGIFQTVYGDESQEDFILLELKDYANFNEKFVLEIQKNTIGNIDNEKVSYELIGLKKDLENFSKCVEINIIISDKNIRYEGLVKKWGIYHVDIVPIYDNVLMSNWAWWNSSYNNMINCTISNKYQNQPIYAEIDYYAGMNITFADLRFTSPDNITELPYFIMNYTSNTQAEFLINNTGNYSYVNMYYNNTLVNTASNGSNVFWFFDHFDDGSINTALWDQISGSSVESGTYINISYDHGSVSEVLQSDDSFGSNNFWTRMYLDDESTNNRYMGQLITGDHVLFQYDDGQDAVNEISRTNNGDNEIKTIGTAYFNNMYNKNYRWISGGYFVYFFYNDMEIVKNIHNQEIPDANMPVYLRSAQVDTSIVIDWIGLSNYQHPIQNISSFGSVIEKPNCTDNCIISDLELNDLNFANKTTNVEDCEDYFNFTIDIEDCLGDIDYINISLEDNGYTNHTNQGNGTYWHNVTDFLDCNTNYTLWINTSCQNGAVKLNYYYWFVTESCCVASVEAVKWDGIVVNTTQNCKDYNVSYINMSAFVNSTCDNEIEYVNFSISSGNYSVWTNEAEGLYWVNWTGIPLTCEQNISIWINVSDGDDCNDDVLNLTYWFNTCACEDEEECCSYTLGSVYPVNKTNCFSNNSIINFTVWLNTTCSQYNFSYVNISFGTNYTNYSDYSEGQFFGNFTLDNNLTCGENYTWYVVFSKNDTNCSEVNLSFWFTTCGCTGDVNCSSCWNDSNFIAQYNLRFNSSIDYWENNGSMEIDPANGLVILVIWIGSLVLLFKSRNYVLSGMLVMFFLMLGVFEYVVITGYIGFTSWIIILVLGAGFGLYRIFDMKGEKHNV